MRLKILGLVALAALVAAMGVIGLSQEQASADAVPAPVATVAASVVSVSGFFNEDDSCSTGPATCSASVSVSPASAVTTPIILVRCDIDTSGNGSVADEAAAAPATGNCIAPADSDLAAAVYTLTGPVVGGLDGGVDTINNVWRLNVSFGCSSLVATTVVITYQQDNIASSTTATCAATGGTPVLAINKIDQNGGLRTATFGIGPVNFSAAGFTMVTGTSSNNPCLSSNNCATNPNNNIVGGAFPPAASGGVTLPTNTVLEIREIGAPATCTLVEIKLGASTSTTVLPLSFPVQVLFDGAAWSVSSNGTPFGTVGSSTLSLTYVNSCAIAGGAVAANSSIALVIGGSTQGLTNATHLEIVPAPGSDNDARLDIRVRDANLTPLSNAHVTVLTDRGAIAMRADTTGTGPTGVPSGYDVIEPSAPNFGANISGDTCDQPGDYQAFTTPYNGTVTSPIFSGSRQVQDGYTNADGILSLCLFVDDTLAPGITPGKATLTVIIENPSPLLSSYQPIYAPQNLVLTQVVTVVGPPASVKVAASPTSVQCGEKATITATVTDSVGQNVSDHTRVELVSNYGSTIGGTGATLGFPGVGPVNPISSSAAETFSGVATAFLLTSTEHVGPYEVVVATGGSVGGYAFNYNTLSGYVQPGVVNTVGAFSTAPVSAQVTVTCALPSVAGPIVAPPIVAPRTGEGIRPPNTGDAGLLLIAD